MACGFDMRMPASEQGSSSDDEGIPQHRDNEELQQRRDDEVMALEAILPPSDFLCLLYTSDAADE